MTTRLDTGDRSRRQVVATLAAVKVTSAVSFSWFGRSVGRPSPDVRRALSSDQAHGHLVAVLTEQLYRYAYCLGGPRVAIPGPSAHSATFGGSPFVEALEAANAGTGRWEHGWSATEVDEREAVLTNGRLEIRAPRSSCRSMDRGDVRPGAAAVLWTPKGAPAASPGFYSAISDTPFEPSPLGRVVRIYWNVTPDAAIVLVRRVTTVLNSTAVPFLLKVRADPGGFNRCDAGVLYLSGADVRRALDLLSPAFAEISPRLRSSVPMFTLPLAPGVGASVDPGAGESFGVHRCAALADGIVRAHHRGEGSPRRRFAAVESSFAESGVALDEPYMSIGDDLDAVGFRAEPRGFAPGRVTAEGPWTDAAADDWFEVAARLAERLCRDAMWHDGQCNWLGVVPGSAQTASTNSSPTFAALDGDLYGGTSGVALFLAELAARTGSPKASAAARGAIERSLDRCASTSDRSVGLYVGRIGTALAAARVGAALGDHSLVERALDLARVTETERLSAGHDLLAGLAGTIVGLLALHRLTNDADLLDDAVACGGHLLRSSTSRSDGLSWPPSSDTESPHLTGLSHGASGIGYALNELTVATRDSSYHRAASRAFAFERAKFDDREQNWPDLRTDTVRRIGRRHAFMTTWCHGAPGVALARLRAHELFGDRRCNREARTALDTTRRSVTEDLADGLANYSLCHGMAGTARVLVEGARVLPDRESDADLATSVAAAGVRWFAGDDQEWPCGAGIGTTPGLMMGLAGIGYFYLSLADPTLPSVLTFGPTGDGAAP